MISKDLFLAILSMDSYNRGYGAGLEVTGDKVGAARNGNRPTVARRAGPARPAKRRYLTESSIVAAILRQIGMQMTPFCDDLVPWIEPLE